MKLFSFVGIGEGNDPTIAERHEGAVVAKMMPLALNKCSIWEDHRFTRVRA